MFLKFCFAECDPDEYLLNNFCYKECPSHFFATNETVETEELEMNVIVVPRSGDKSSGNTQMKLLCQMCNLMCLECFGPLPNQCKTCPSGYIMTINNTCMQYVRTYGHHRIETTSIVIAVFVCLSAGTIFLMVFLCLQARDHGYCSANKYTGICLEDGKGRFGKLDLTDSEEEQFSKADLLDSSDELD